ncbi:MAG TPA: methyltransferase [Gaiellaceae bacterium]|nr:methyltransferase [Gaiellaceae bacterium]
MRGLLVEPDCRLVTLTGTGGIGKTRLALEAARTAASDFEHGAVFVALEHARTAEQVESELATALGLDAQPAETLAEHFAESNLLLVLDNLASDDPQGSIGETYVPDVSRSSATLAALTIRRPVERALDVGTGNGIQAILASRHAGAVVATDVSERAACVRGVQLRPERRRERRAPARELPEPVAGDRFGLLVSNPPFAISPENDFVFRDSGLGRDRVSEELVLALPSVLAPDGSPP